MAAIRVIRETMVTVTGARRIAISEAGTTETSGMSLNTLKEMREEITTGNKILKGKETAGESESILIKQFL
jgi:hypothetical protein